jgi:hypothetical protein
MKMTWGLCDFGAKSGFRLLLTIKPLLCLLATKPQDEQRQLPAASRDQK